MPSAWTFRSGHRRNRSSITSARSTRTRGRTAASYSRTPQCERVDRNRPPDRKPPKEAFAHPDLPFGRSRLVSVIRSVWNRRSRNGSPGPVAPRLCWRRERESLIATRDTPIKTGFFNATRNRPTNYRLRIFRSFSFVSRLFSNFSSTMTLEMRSRGNGLREASLRPAYMSGPEKPLRHLNGAAGGAVARPTIKGRPSRKAWPVAHAITQRQHRARCRHHRRPCHSCGEHFHPAFIASSFTTLR